MDKVLVENQYLWLAQISELDVLPQYLIISVYFYIEPKASGSCLYQEVSDKKTRNLLSHVSKFCQLPLS